ncbi:MAG: hypothetical protein M5U09_13160 [Gammaproteobacteria bacterium]|nr:hypothetical protein [Gammaproteobacteria bacterium]
MVISLALSTIIGIPLGVIAASAARRRRRPPRRAACPLPASPFPAFLIGMLLQMLFYGWLGWLPLQSRIAAEVLLDHPFDRVTGLYLVDTLLAGNHVAFQSALAHRPCR